MEGHPLKNALPGLHEFDFIGDGFKDNFLCSICSDVLLGTKPSNDMNTASFLQLVEILDEITFPSNDTVPGGFDHRTSVL